MPDPGALLEKLASGEAMPARQASAPAAAAAPAATAAKTAPQDFRALVDYLATTARQPHLAQQLHDYCGLVRYAPPELIVRPAKPLSGDFVRDMGNALKAMTGETWQIRVADEPAEPTLLEQEKMAAETLRQSVLDSPMVKAAFEAFPGAELAGYTFEQRSA
jgi:DNA polymerase-3 subunit gamma/tau